MDNQHRKIKGYRELSQTEIDLMNKVKELSAKVGELVSELEHYNVYKEDTVIVDRRWVEIGKSDLQKGFMGLTRSIAKPDFF